MTTHNAIWYDHDGYITEYSTVTLNNGMINEQDFVTPTDRTCLPEGWPIYRLEYSIAEVAIDPKGSQQ